MEKITLIQPLVSVRVRPIQHGIQQGLEASICRAEYLPVIWFKTLNEILTVEDVHAFDTGAYHEWTRYYREQQGYDVEVFSGINYHLENGGKKFDLIEYLNQRCRHNQYPEIWLTPELCKGEAFNEALFHDTLIKALTAIYKGIDVEVPDLSALGE